MVDTLRAVIFVPRGNDTAYWLRICVEHCEARGYFLDSVILGGQWRDAIAMLGRGDVEVVVIGREDHRPADRTPRVEVVGESP